MYILWGGPSSLLLGQLLIPVGAKLTIRVLSFDRIIEDHLPRSLDNLRNLSNFTKMYVSGFHLRMRFSGPNGELYAAASGINITLAPLVLESLARFDTSRTEQLEIDRVDPPSSRDHPYRTLLPMKNLHTLTLSRCQNLHAFIDALCPNMSSSGVICPKLEELVFRTGREEFNIGSVIAMAAERASRGAKLRIVRILDERGKVDPGDVLELGKHVVQVEYGPEVDVVNDDSDGSNEGD
jgi:hypothetical protein